MSFAGMPFVVLFSQINEDMMISTLFG